MLIRSFAILPVLLSIWTYNSIACGQLIKPGAGLFDYLDGKGENQRKITVWYYMPSGFLPDGDLLFVMHGTLRNGQQYRDNWIDIAKRHKILIVVPEFSEKQYPSSRHYQQGNVLQEDGTPLDHSLWSLSSIDRIFQHLVQKQKLKCQEYDIFGHSGGAQFVHRMVLLYPQTRVRLAISANAGWYSMPDLQTAYPYGLGGTTVDRSTLKAALQQRLIILLGEEDNDPNHRFLRRTPEAIAQGSHRLSRGEAFFNSGRKKASELGVEFAWKLVSVPDVGHENSKMAMAAAEFLASDERLDQTQ